MWYEIIDRGGEIFMVVLPRNSNHLVLYNTKLLSSASVYEMAIVLTKQGDCGDLDTDTLRF